MVSALDQLTLAEFITSGGFDRHVRSRRQSYRRRRDQLVAALAQSAPDIRVTGMAAGLQAVLELPPGTESWVLQAAAREGLMVSGMAEFRHEELEGQAAGQDAIVVNYSAVSDSAWKGALNALCSVMP
jgi:GntR family transcriptional regulator/MocR family aminotransferase